MDVIDVVNQRLLGGLVSSTMRELNGVSQHIACFVALSWSVRDWVWHVCGVVLAFFGRHVFYWLCVIGQATWRGVRLGQL